ncbi:hypothetical protein M2475_001849 [Breznakia sp. PF5-3]|uniref:hypothetical protein n=1 Tax=unclassified Breznakia TaxID=2623764 RepID=UPI002405FF98|nr:MULTISPECIES: hypothetical protein [unclassified Breznakia]MDF9825394.1 hypothetical protein [Breznakia sp. PM6-1]MDF9836272.1 hypothetical protein [Breznakia sp. PF5-3]MDF9837576.1 hypothetical protein [Breznakia sp. PFB2-8]MDF9860189.1 hypothetical protein [Breznakia sp. PH5-24]
MKKILSVLIMISLLLIGCSNNNRKKETIKREEVPQEIQKAPELNHAEMMNNDRSSIAGDYINPNGEVITVNADGTLNFHGSMNWDVSNQSASDVYYTEEGIYGWALVPKDHPTGAGGVMIFPVGVDVKGFIVQEDGTVVLGTLSTNKETIRMTQGQSAPNEEEVYTKR